MWFTLEQHLIETGQVTPTALVNSGRLRTIRTRANYYAIIAAVERGPREAHEISCENWEFQIWGSLKVFLTMGWVRYTCLVMHISLYMVALCTYFTCNDNAPIVWSFAILCHLTVTRMKTFQYVRCVTLLTYFGTRKQTV